MKQHIRSHKGILLNDSRITILSRLFMTLAAGAALLGTGAPGHAQTLTTSWTNTFDNSSGSQNSSTSWNYWYDIAGNSGLMSLDTNKNSTLLPPPTSGPNSGALLFLTPWPGVPENSGKGGQDVIYGTFDGGGRYNTGTTIDATKYESLSFDLYVDPSSPTNSAGHVCRLTVGFFVNNYSTYTITNVIIGTNNFGQWLRYVCPINPATAPAPPAPLAAGPMFNINCYGGENANLFTNTTPTTMWIDNIYLKLSKVVVPPPVMSKTITTPNAGLNLFSAPPSTDQYQRNSIKLLSNSGVGWLGQTNVTYSMTITNFPDGSVYNGYQAHLFITTGAGTASALDYNETNVVWLNIQANSNNTGVAYFRYKINEWAANSNMFGAEFTNGPAQAGTLTNLPAATPLGTWTLTFNQDTNVTITEPGGASVNFNMRPEAVAPFVEPLNIVFGAQPNNTYNVGQEVIMSAVSGTNAGAGFSIVSDDFLADGTLNTGIWTILTGEPNTVFVFPLDPGQRIVSWSLPASGFGLQTATNVAPNPVWTTLSGSEYTGTPLTSWTVGGRQLALVPSADLDTNQDYFRMFTRKFTKLQVLMPGESAAPGTVSGKVGSPDPQTVSNAFNVIVNAVDDNWFQATYNADDAIHITSSDSTATLPSPDPTMIAGTATVSVTFNTTNSTFTVTASDVTRPSKTANTGSPTTVP
jgi:hypothetical protein